MSLYAAVTALERDIGSTSFLVSVSLKATPVLRVPGVTDRDEGDLIVPEFVYWGVIYLITNLVNGKQYIGQTTNDKPVGRWKGHIDSSIKNSKNILHMALRKYGVNNFTFEVIYTCFNQEYLDEAEDVFIELYGTLSPRGYNMRHGGRGGKHSPELSKKMSLIRSKPEVIERMSAAATKAMNDPIIAARHLKACIEAWENEELREIQRIHALDQHSDPIKKERHREGCIRGNASPEVKTKRSRSATAAHARPSTKIKFKEAAKRASNTPEEIKRRREMFIGTRYITSGKENKRIKNEELPPEGWRFGLTWNSKK